LERLARLDQREILEILVEQLELLGQRDQLEILAEQPEKWVLLEPLGYKEKLDLLALMDLPEQQDLEV
jgi:hypothetical protein